MSPLVDWVAVVKIFEIVKLNLPLRWNYIPRHLNISTWSICSSPKVHLGFALKTIVLVLMVLMVYIDIQAILSTVMI